MATSEERLTASLVHILDYFAGPDRQVFSQKDLQEILTEKREEWKLTKVTFSQFQHFLTTVLKLRQEVLRARGYRPITRFVWGEASDYALAQSLRSRGYFSHGTAVFLHGFNDQIPDTIYVNQEQSTKPPPTGGLTQERLNFAFRRKQRISNYVYRRGNRRIVLLNGKNTEQLGVETMALDEKTSVRVTNVERTLIDIVVRPAYAGGIFQVAQAYRSARGLALTEEMGTLLRRLGYVYPYHQAIGFLLERAGFANEELQPFREQPFKFDFYLTHGLKNPDYDESWRLFVPKGL